MPGPSRCSRETARWQSGLRGRTAQNWAIRGLIIRRPTASAFTLGAPPRTPPRARARALSSRSPLPRRGTREAPPRGASFPPSPFASLARAPRGGFRLEARRWGSERRRVLWRHPIDASAEDVAVVTSFDSPGARVIALGTNTAPGRVHFLAAPLEEDALESPSFSPPPVCGARAFALERLRPRRAPGVLTVRFRRGAVRGGAPGRVPRLRDGRPARRRLPRRPSLPGAAPRARARGGRPRLRRRRARLRRNRFATRPSPPPAFVFVTWTTPSRAIKLAVDREESRSTLRRVASRTMPAGIDRVASRRRTRDRAPTLFSSPRIRAQPSSPRSARPTSPSRTRSSCRPNGGFIRAGTMTATDESLEEGAAMSFWVTRGNPGDGVSRSTSLRSGWGSSPVAPR